LSAISYRRAEPGDEHAIVDLFYQIAPRGHSVDYWRWLNSRAPYGPGIVELIVSDDLPIGHYAVVPMRLTMMGRDISAGFAMQVGIHRAHRGLGSLRRMCDRVWQAAADAGFEFVYGFPNENIWLIYARMMKWQLVAHFRSWQYPLAERGAPDLPGAAAGIEVRRITEFDGGFDDLWARSAFATGAALSVVRDARYLNWRYFGHPVYHYKVLAAWEGNRPVGYAVLKFFHDGKNWVGHFVDFLTQQKDGDAIARRLLAAGFEAFVWQQVDIVSLWLSPSHPAHPLLEEIGFAANGFQSRLGYRPTDGRVPPAIGSLAAWNLTMGDSDAF
jgi:hypothetical protein